MPLKSFAWGFLGFAGAFLSAFAGLFVWPRQLILVGIAGGVAVAGVGYARAPRFAAAALAGTVLGIAPWATLAYVFRDMGL